MTTSVDIDASDDVRQSGSNDSPFQQAESIEPQDDPGEAQNVVPGQEEEEDDGELP